MTTVVKPQLEITLAIGIDKLRRIEVMGFVTEHIDVPYLGIDFLTNYDVKWDFRKTEVTIEITSATLTKRVVIIGNGNRKWRRNCPIRHVASCIAQDLWPEIFVTLWQATCYRPLQCRLTIRPSVRHQLTLFQPSSECCPRPVRHLDVSLEPEMPKWRQSLLCVERRQNCSVTASQSSVSTSHHQLHSLTQTNTI